MKTMKRAFSFVIVLALLLSFALSGSLTSTISVRASAITSGSTLTINGFNKKGNLGDVITVPKGADNITIEIKDPHGKKLTEADYTENTTESIKFVANKLGYYTVQYFVNNDITKSQVYTIKIVGTMPTIEFEENAEIYIPETISSNIKVILPAPIVTKANGTVLDYTLKHRGDASATTNDVIVSVKSPLADSYATLEYDEDGNVVFTPMKDENGNYIYGTYTVRYSYQGDTIAVSKSAEIKVEENFESVIEKIKMSFVWKDNGSMPTSGNLGAELVLPRPVAQDKTRANQEIQSYVQVKVQFIGADGSVKDYDFDYANFSFTPMDKTENGGYYKVEYTISNYFGVDTIKRTYEIRNVTDKVRPTIYIVNSYTTEQAQNGTVNLKDLTYMIPNRIIASYTDEIIIPALYAIDNFETYDNLTLKRYFKSKDRTILLDNDTYPVNSNLVLKVDGEDMNEYVNTCLKTPGTYTIRYEARDKSNAATIIDIEIVVLDRDNNAMDELAPEIENLSLTKTTYAGEKVTFKVPSVFDYTMVTVDGVAQKITGQQKCLVEAGYYIGSNYASFIQAFKNGEDISSYISSGEFVYVNKDADDDSYYSFIVPNVSANATIYVVVRATDNAKFGMPNSSSIAKNNIAVKEGTIRLINVDPSTITPPTLTSTVKSTIRDFAQKEVIDICELSTDGKFVFAGANADFTKISVNVYDANGKEISVRGLVTSTNSAKTEVTLKKATFTTTRNGSYIIVITATDIANNSTIVAYQIEVNDTIPPVINEREQVPTQVIVGTTIELPSIITLDNGEEITNLADEEISFDGFDNPSYDFTSGDNMFTPHEIGTYTFKYIASDGTNTVELIKTIEAVADTSLRFDDNDAISSYWENQDLVLLEDGTYRKITIPYISVIKDGDLNVEIYNYDVTITGPNGKVMTKTEVANGFEFEPSAKDGVYTIKYRAVEKLSGQAVTLEKTIKVGDTVAPSLVIKNEGTNLPKNAKLNSELVISADDIVYSDTITAQDDISLVITIKDTNGNIKTLTKENNSYSYKFEQAGSYTLTYTVTDKAGNSTTKTTEIVVKAESSTEKSVTTIWGIVLIVISVAFLLGVVVYFVVTNKKLKPSKEKARQNAKIVE